MQPDPVDQIIAATVGKQAFDRITQRRNRKALVLAAFPTFDALQVLDSIPPHAKIIGGVPLGEHYEARMRSAYPELVGILVGDLEALVHLGRMRLGNGEWVIIASAE